MPQNFRKKVFWKTQLIFSTFWLPLFCGALDVNLTQVTVRYTWMCPPVIGLSFRCWTLISLNVVAVKCSICHFINIGVQILPLFKLSWPKCFLNSLFLVSEDSKVQHLINEWTRSLLVFILHTCITRICLESQPPPPPFALPKGVGMVRVVAVLSPCVPKSREWFSLAALRIRCHPPLGLMGVRPPAVSGRIPPPPLGNPLQCCAPMCVGAEKAQFGHAWDQGEGYPDVENPGVACSELAGTFT